MKVARKIKSASIFLIISLMFMLLLGCQEAPPPNGDGNTANDKQDGWTTIVGSPNATATQQPQNTGNDDQIIVGTGDPDEEQIVGAAGTPLPNDSRPPSWSAPNKQPANDPKPTQPPSKQPANDPKPTQPPSKQPANDPKPTQPPSKQPANDPKPTQPPSKQPANDPKPNTPLPKNQLGVGIKALDGDGAKWSAKALEKAAAVIKSLPKSFTQCTTAVVRDASYQGNTTTLGWVRDGGTVVHLTNVTCKPGLFEGTLIHEMTHCFQGKNRSIETKWRKTFWPNGRNPTSSVSTYGNSAHYEDMAESVRVYWQHGASMKQSNPKRYEFVKNYVMGGVEF